MVKGSILGLIKGDTRSLDYGPMALRGIVNSRVQKLKESTGTT